MEVAKMDALVAAQLAMVDANTPVMVVAPLAKELAVTHVKVDVKELQDNQ